MGTSLTIDGFVSALKGSGLVEPEGLDAILHDLEGRAYRDPAPFAQTLIRRGVLTEWQAGKVLSGVQKGFFLGKHKVLRLVGEGAMSSVYEAEHMLMHRRVAIKVLCKTLAAEPSYLERFYREAQALARLNHPNIVRGLDVGQDGDHHYLVMEFVDGPSLEELVVRCGPLMPDHAADVIRQAALGLEHAHVAGFVHRDIKPSNIKLEAGRVVKVLDLGLVRSVIQDEREASLTRRHDQKVLGTIDYLSPEQAVDGHVVDIRADVYSLGCTLYYLLTGSAPFPQGTLAERLLAHQMKAPAPVASRRPDVPEGLIDILNRMMEKRPADRYPTPGAVAAAISDWSTKRRPAANSTQELPTEASSAPAPPAAGRKAPIPSGGGTWTDPRRSGALTIIDRVRALTAPTWAGPVRTPAIDYPPASPIEPDGGRPTATLIQQWRQWYRVVAPIADKRRSRQKADNRSYRVIYAALLQACRAERESADLPTQALLARIEKLVAPWVSINALRGFLADSASGNFVNHLHELDFALRPRRRVTGNLRVPILLATNSIAWVAIFLGWQDEPAVDCFSVGVQALWSSCRHLIPGR